MGTTLFLEYESLLARDELFETCQLDREEREVLLNAFLSVCRWSDVSLGCVNKLIEELSTIALTQFEAETCFRARATHGSVATGLQLLEKLDALTENELE